MSLTTYLSPTRRNGVARYLKRYLDTVTDWQTYTEIPGPTGFSDQARQVTETFFSPGKLKGMALLLSAHLLQQASASLVSIVARTLLRGRMLDTYRGLAVRKSRTDELWDRMPDWLKARITPTDGYYFLEGGRTWHCQTISVAFPQGVTRQLTVLILLAFPNRSYLFDRTLPYNRAIDLVQSRIEPELIDGYIGDTRELDCFLPLLSFIKLGLYALNWFLVDEAERDAGGPEVRGYGDLDRPPGPGTLPGNPTAAPPPPPPSTSSPWADIYRPGEPNPYPPPRSSSYNPHYPGPGQPQPYWPAWQPVPPAAPQLELVPQPVSVRLASGPDQAPIWCRVQDNAYHLHLPGGRPTGLALTPLVEPLPDGNFRELTDRWHLTHLETGYSLTETPLDNLGQARDLAGRLIHIDWTQPLELLDPADLDRAKRLIDDFMKSQNVNGNHHNWR